MALPGAILSVPGVVDFSLSIGTSAAALAVKNIVIGTREKAVTNADAITIVREAGAWVRAISPKCWTSWRAPTPGRIFATPAIASAPRLTLGSCSGPLRGAWSLSTTAATGWCYGITWTTLRALYWTATGQISGSSVEGPTMPSSGCLSKSKWLPCCPAGTSTPLFRLLPTCLTWNFPKWSFGRCSRPRCGCISTRTSWTPKGWRLPRSLRSW